MNIHAEQLLLLQEHLLVPLRIVALGETKFYFMPLSIVLSFSFTLFLAFYAHCYVLSIHLTYLDFPFSLSSCQGDAVLSQYAFPTSGTYSYTLRFTPMESTK